MTKSINSRIENMRSMSPTERLDAVATVAHLSQADQDILAGENILPMDKADGMIENVVGKFELPMGIATNFTVNGKDYLVPMVVEEPSVVAAASYMAKIVRANGGFQATADEPLMRAQVQVLGITDVDEAKKQILANADDIIALANSRDKILLQLGGGCKRVEVHTFPDTPVGPMVVMHLIVNVCDAMGANTVNTMAEMVAPMVEKITGGQVRLRILSNLADLRVVRARVDIDPDTLTTKTLDGHDMARGMVEACTLAIIDPYRAATHNKGIMNGIDPVVIATGNDWRAIEAGAHAYASRNGQYTSLTNWEINADNKLVGTIELPMALGLVGGATKTHPTAQTALKTMHIESASELAQVVAAVGLSQNMAAIRALATDGIQKGHMALHARNIAILAGATGTDIDRVAKTLVADENITVEHAKAIL